MPIVGSNILASHGSRRFLKLLAVCMEGSATAGLITYAAFNKSRSLALLRLQPFTIVTATLRYAFAFSDKDVSVVVQPTTMPYCWRFDPNYLN